MKQGLLVLLTMGWLSFGCALTGGGAVVVQPTQPVLGLTTTSTPQASVAAPTALPTQVSMVVPTSTKATVPLCQVRQDWPTYTVVSGDTLGAIANRIGVTVDTLVQGNCLSNANSLSVGQVLRVPVPVPTLAPATAVSSSTSWTTTTYTDSLYKWSISFPSDWYTSGKDGRNLDILSFDPMTAAGRGGVPDDQVKMSVVVEATTGSTYEAFVQRKKAEWQAPNADGQPSMPVLQTQEWTLAINVPALRVTGAGLGEVYILLTVIDGMEIQITGFGNSDLFNRVASSIRR